MNYLHNSRIHKKNKEFEMFEFQWREKKYFKKMPFQYDYFPSHIFIQQFLMALFLIS